MLRVVCLRAFFNNKVNHGFDAVIQGVLHQRDAHSPPASVIHTDVAVVAWGILAFLAALDALPDADARIMLISGEVVE